MHEYCIYIVVAKWVKFACGLVKKSFTLKILEDYWSFKGTESLPQTQIF